MRLASVVLAASLLLHPAEGLARELKISHQRPGKTDARDRAVQIFAQEVQSRTPGITFRIYPQLSLNIKAEEQFDAMQSGRLDMSVYVLSYAVNKSPEFSLAVLPGLYPSLDAVRGLKGSRLLEHLQAIANANGVHVLAWYWVPGGFATSKREVGGPASVKGLKAAWR